MSIYLKQFIIVFLILCTLPLYNYFKPTEQFSEKILNSGEFLKFGEMQNTEVLQNGSNFGEIMNHHFFQDLNFTEKRRYFLDGRSYRNPCIQFEANLTSDIFVNYEEREKFESKELEIFQRYRFLPKRVFKSTPQIVFTVGLESTGHHFFWEAWTRTCKLVRILCEPEKTFNRIVSDGPQRQRLLGLSAQAQLKQQLELYKFKLLILNTYPGMRWSHSLE